MTQDPRSPTMPELPIEKEKRNKQPSREEQKKQGQLPLHDEPIGGA